MGFDPVGAFNLILERLDRIAEALEKLVVALAIQTNEAKKKGKD